MPGTSCDPDTFLTSPLIVDFSKFRRGFAPSSFQAVSYTDLFTRPFEDVLSSGEMLRDFDQQILGGGDETAFFRANTRDYHLSNFLGIVVSDGTPLSSCALVVDIFAR
jgi:hypothetical protein